MCKDEGKPEESGPETDSMQCCKDMCPHKNEVLNKAHCENVVCGEDDLGDKDDCWVCNLHNDLEEDI